MKRYKFISTVLLCISLTIAFSQAIISNTHGIVKTKTGTHNHSTKKQRTYIVSGTVQQTFSYCGGARPSQAMLDKLAMPKTYPDKKFYVRKGNANNSNAKIVTTFITDSAGGFSIRLKPGIYSIIVEEQLHPIKPNEYINENQQMDSKCLDEWWAKPYYLLEVKNKNINDLNFVFHHRCFISNDIPCITYQGPLPP